MTKEEVKALREAWARVKSGTATDDQWLLLMRQPPQVLDLLKTDYDAGQNPYR